MCIRDRDKKMKFKKITSTLMALLMIFTVFLGPSTLSAEAVSYTHLDVYKRQE